MEACDRLMLMIGPTAKTLSDLEELSDNKDEANIQGIN